MQRILFSLSTVQSIFNAKMGQIFILYFRLKSSKKSKFLESKIVFFICITLRLCE